MTKVIQPLFRCTSFLVLMFLFGCSSTTLRLNDKSAPRGSVVVNKTLNEVWKLQADVSYLKGEDRVAIDDPTYRYVGENAFEIINYEFRLFGSENEENYGPDSLQADFTMETAELSLYYKLVRKNKFRFNIGPGLIASQSNIEAMLQSNGRELSIDRSSVCAALKMEAIFPLDQNFSLFLGSANNLKGGPCKKGDHIEIVKYNASVLYNVNKHISFTLGYYQQEYENDDEFETNIDLTASGLNLGVQLHF